MSQRGTTVHLIRHGETLRPGYCNGHLDVELTATGIAEMEAVARRLSGQEIVALYASDLRRAAHGAEIVGRVLNLKPVILPLLREKCFGEWEGLPKEELLRRFPNEWNDWVTNPADAKPSGGESCRELAARVVPVIQEIAKRHLGEKLAVVTHGGVNRVLLCHALNLELRYMERIAQRHAALNIIEFFEDGAVVRLVNG